MPLSTQLILDSSTEHLELGTVSAHTPEVLQHVNPLRDPRWTTFVLSHPQASLFHSIPWLESLQRTYGYEPVALTTSQPNEPLANAVVLCRVESWLTGRRLVSLPFSDHCAPLLRDPLDQRVLLDALQREALNGSWRYIELRPLEPIPCEPPHCQPSAEYAFHTLDLRPSFETLFKNLHKNSIQRKIQRAEREGLLYQERSGTTLLAPFYRLLVLTRRRHQVPPQPKAWFRNLCHCFGDALKIRIALWQGRPVAGMLTVRFKDALVYKYGASDARYNKLGGMHLLYWRSIQDAKNSGLRIFDLGRADADQKGLITFKSRWGASQAKLTYFRLTADTNAMHLFDPASSDWKMRLAKRAFEHAPSSVLAVLGKALYRHVG
jgi:CelD/BcsL family acetyltransferase involved in cellulose biosynthesis